MHSFERRSRLQKLLSRCRSKTAEGLLSFSMDAFPKTCSIVRHRWQFSYVETLTWVQLRPQHELVMQPSPYFRQSHVSLLMFRRTGVVHI